MIKKIEEKGVLGIFRDKELAAKPREMLNRNGQKPIIRWGGSSKKNRDLKQRAKALFLWGRAEESVQERPVEKKGRGKQEDRHLSLNRESTDFTTNLRLDQSGKQGRIIAIRKWGNFAG